MSPACNWVRRGDESQGALKDLVQRHLDFYGGLIEQSLTFHQNLLDTLKEMGRPSKETAPKDSLSLNLRTPQNSTLRAPFKITNTRADPVTIVCKASPFVSEDGTQLVAAAVAFDPPGAEIQPGVEALFDTIIAVGDGFSPGSTYLATLSVEGLDAMRIVVRLTVDPAMPVAPAAPDSVKPPDPAAPAAQAAAPAPGTEVPLVAEPTSSSGAATTDAAGRARPRRSRAATPASP